MINPLHLHERKVILAKLFLKDIAKSGASFNPAHFFDSNYIDQNPDTFISDLRYQPWLINKVKEYCILKEMPHAELLGASLYNEYDFKKSEALDLFYKTIISDEFIDWMKATTELGDKA